MNSGRQFCLKNARLCVQSFKKTLPASHVSRSNEGTLTKQVIHYLHQIIIEIEDR